MSSHTAITVMQIRPIQRAVGAAAESAASRLLKKSFIAVSSGSVVGRLDTI